MATETAQTGWVAQLRSINAAFSHQEGLLGAQLTALQAEIEQLRTSALQHQSQVAVLEQNLAKCEAEREAGQQHSSELIAELDHRNSELQRLQSSVASLQARLSEQARSHIDELHHEREASAETAQLTRSLLDQHQGEIERLQLSVTSLQALLIEQAQTHIDELNRAHSTSAEVAQSSQSRLAHLAAEALERADRLTATVGALGAAEAALKIARHEALSLQLQLESARTELTKVRTSWIWRLFMAGRPSSTSPLHALPVGSASLQQLDPHESPSVQSSPMNDFTTDPRLARTNIEHALTLFDLAFVKQVYLVVLGRDVDPDGLVHRLRSVRAGEDRESLILSLALSDECIARHVEIDGMQELLDSVVAARYPWPVRGIVRAWCWSALQGGSHWSRQFAKLALRGSSNRILKALRAIDNRLAMNAVATEIQIRHIESFVSRLASVSAARSSVAPVTATETTSVSPRHRPSAGLPAAQSRLEAELLAQLQKALSGRKV